ncbi:MAG: response regulator [Burkholderiaceae bacterium]
MRLLLIEDDGMVGEAVATALRADGHVVDWVRRRDPGDTALRTHDYDALLLDLGLPDGDGLELLRQLRARGQTLPVLIMTARDALEQRVAGLDAGADDYLLKPFEVDELLARLRALQRRIGGRASEELRLGEVTIDTAARRVSVAGEPVSLSAREWAVLEPLITRPGAVLSRAQLEDRLYGWGDEVNSNAVEVHIHHLRRKLGAGLIRTVRGVGYMVVSP